MGNDRSPFPSDTSAPLADRTAEAQREGAAQPRVERESLFVLLEGSRPLAGGARCVLHGIDTVVLGRAGHRSFTKKGRTLTVGVPDPLMSGQHATLTRTAEGFVLADTASRNGITSATGRVKAQTCVDGDWFQCGATVFALRTAMLFDDEERVLESAMLPGRDLGVATLSADYAERLSAVARIAPSSLSMLLLGESGSGKEVLARGVHRMSGRGGPLVAVNCGAFSASLLESQLFGHVRGAFSGAVRDEPGFVLAANGGTLFLDEVGELPPPAQAALLRTLETREVVAVGSTKAQLVDVRFLSATLRGTDILRPDLVARLSGHVHRLAPLRARVEDIGLLVAELLPRATPQGEKVRFSPEAARTIVTYDWPMNARELLQALTSACLLAFGDSGGLVETRHLPEALTRAPVDPPLAAPTKGAPSRSVRKTDEARREELVGLLRTHAGNVSQIARAMNTTRMQIHRWVEKLDLRLDDFREPPT